MIGIIAGCSSVQYIKPELPEFGVGRPERPSLSKAEGVPIEAAMDLALMIGYAEHLETIIDGWESFYEGLREIYVNDNQVK